MAPCRLLELPPRDREQMQMRFPKAIFSHSLACNQVTFITTTTTTTTITVTTIIIMIKAAAAGFFHSYSTLN